MDTATLPETAATLPASYRRHARLADQTPLLLRSIRPDDKARLHAHFRTLSTDSVIQRFFEAKGNLTEADLAFYTELDHDSHFALVAVLEEDGEERIVGVGRAIESPGTNGGRSAEVAFAVADAYQGRGIGSLLLHHLAILGRHLGYDRFEAWVLPANGRMLDVFLHSGFAVRRTLEDGTIHVRFPITAGAEAG